MPRSAQSLLPPLQAAGHTAIRRAPATEDLRTPAERVQIIAIWTAAVVFSLAFWAAVTMICMS